MRRDGWPCVAVSAHLGEVTRAGRVAVGHSIEVEGGAPCGENVRQLKSQAVPVERSGRVEIRHREMRLEQAVNWRHLRESFRAPDTGPFIDRVTSRKSLSSRVEMANTT